MVNLIGLLNLEKKYILEKALADSKMEKYRNIMKECFNTRINKLEDKDDSYKSIDTIKKLELELSNHKENMDKYYNMIFNELINIYNSGITFYDIEITLRKSNSVIYIIAREIDDPIYGTELISHDKENNNVCINIIIGDDVYNSNYDNLKYDNLKYDNLNYDNLKYDNLKYNNLKYDNLERLKIAGYIDIFNEEALKGTLEKIFDKTDDINRLNDY